MPIQLTIWPSAEQDPHYLFEYEEGEVVVGRGPEALLRLPYPFVSGHQFTIVAEGESYLITDGGSTNGTILNGKRLAQFAYQPLSAGDVIKVGEMKMEIDLLPSSTPSMSLEVSGETLRQMVWATLDLPEERATLQVVAGPDKGAKLSIGEAPVIIGSDDSCDLVLQAAAIQARHFSIVPHINGYLLQPHEGGLKFEGKALAEPLALDAEVSFKIKESLFHFEDPFLRRLDEAGGREPRQKRRKVDSTQQIDQEVHYALSKAPPEFGPPDRPPLPAQPKLESSSDNQTTPARSWGMVEVFIVLISATLVFLALWGVITLLD